MYGRVAQSVEQRIENPRVTGSIPVPATSILKVHRDVAFFRQSILMGCRGIVGFCRQLISVMYSS